MINRISLIVLTLFLTSCMSCAGNDNTVATMSSPVQKISDVKGVMQKPDMDAVDFSTQSHIERLCMDYQRQGIPPYWDCLRNELSKLEGVSKPNMDVVDFSTQSLIERRCMDYEREGVIPFWDCLRRELKSIGIEQ